MAGRASVLTIGHSNHSIELFLELLRSHGVTAIADVRSIPASRFNPQFNREPLKRSLHEAGIGYAFLGRELGARSEDPTAYVNGKVQYSRLAQTEAFSHGIERILRGCHEHRLAVMCSEQDPINCHRTLLVARRLDADDVRVEHIHGAVNAPLESFAASVARIRAKFGLDQPNLFAQTDDGPLIEEALQLQEAEIAFVDDAYRTTAGELG